MSADVAVYECVRCQVTHYERFDSLYRLHLRYQSKHGIGYVTEAAATRVMLQRRDDRRPRPRPS